MQSSKKKRSASANQGGQRLLRIAALLGLVAIFALGGLQLGSPNVSVSNASPTPGLGSPTALTFPTVEPGGPLLTPDYTYFHPSALFSLPHLVGWELAANGEERVEPGQGLKLSRAGATFINGSRLSVVHTFVEKDPERTAKTLADLDKYYDQKNLDAAWSNFLGGWKETGRRTDGDRFVIDFQLFLNGNTYLGRQISRFNQDWLMVIRLVAPENNPALLDRLQTVIWPSFVFYPAAAETSILWSSSADTVYGYVVKYPATWVRIQGQAGTPIVVSGQWAAAGAAVTLTTNGEPGKTAKTEAEARAWVMAFRPKATVLSVKPETRGDITGFDVSYNDPDPDGNSRSALVMLLNGANGTLYSANYLSTLRNTDLLTDSIQAQMTEINQSRASFTLLPVSQFVPTLTPTSTPTPTVTPPTTATSAPTSVSTAAATAPPTASAAPTTPATSAAAS